MFTIFGFETERDREIMKEVVRHLGPQLEDLVNLTIYDFPEKYRDAILKHVNEPEFRKVVYGYLLEAYRGQKEAKDLLDKWKIYNIALRKIKKYFIKILKKEAPFLRDEPRGTDVY